MRILAPLAAIALLAAPVWAQHETKQPATPGKTGDKGPGQSGPGAMDPKMQEMMKAWQEAGQTGKFHEYMAQLAGEWDNTVKYRLDASAPWQESKGTASARLMYDGRFLNEEFSGEFMGAPFQGTAVMGYNNLTKKYQGFWFDSMSTQMESTTGTYDPATKTFTLNAECTDPLTGQVKRSREVTTINTPDKRTSEFYEIGSDGKEAKTMEIVYTRKPGTTAPKAGGDAASKAKTIPTKD